MIISIEEAQKLIGKMAKFKPWGMVSQIGFIKSIQLIDGELRAWISDELPIGERKFCPQWCLVDYLTIIEVSLPRETLGGGKTPPIGG